MGVSSGNLSCFAAHCREILGDRVRKVVDIISRIVYCHIPTLFVAAIAPSCGGVWEGGGDGVVTWSHGAAFS